MEARERLVRAAEPGSQLDDRLVRHVEAPRLDGFLERIEVHVVRLEAGAYQRRT